MRNKILLITFIILGLALLYLWFGYAAIYDQIGDRALTNMNISSVYKFNEQSSGEPLVYVALGDSLTYGVGADSYQESFPYLLADKLAGENKPLTLIPLAFPGIKTVDIINNFLDQAISLQPDVITLLIGVNDIHNKDSLTKFNKHYNDLVSSLKTKTKADIYLISLPFIGDKTLMPSPWQEIFLERTIQFNKEIEKIAIDNDLVFIDITSSTQELFKNNGDHYATDHFHPSSLGYKLFENLIYERLNK